MQVAFRAHMPVHHDGNCKVQLDRTKLQMSKYQVVAILPPSKDKELWLCDKCSTIEGIGACAGKPPAKLTKLEAFTAGGLARTVAAAATCPFTIVKTRMEYTGAGRPVPVVVLLAVSLVLPSAQQDWQ